jgi:hypothetical protein
MLDVLQTTPVLQSPLECWSFLSQAGSPNLLLTDIIETTYVTDNRSNKLTAVQPNHAKQCQRVRQYLPQL